MSKHLNDGQLRAALDGELGEIESRHLEGCPSCLERKRLIHSQVRQATGPLTFLAPASSPTPDSDLDARAALRRFQHRTLNHKETSMFKKLFASPALRYGLAALFVLAVIVSVPDTRALAARLLSLFRVQQVAVVPIDFTGMQQLTGRGPIGQQMGRLLSDSVTITQKPGGPVDVADAAQASQLAGFDVRLPEGMSATHISVMGAAAFTFTIDRAKAQALLEEAGHTDLVLPESIDGEDISVTIPSGVSTAYGNCPTPTDGESEREPGGESPGQRYADCTLLAQIPSPTVSAPASVDVPQLARIGLEFTGMSAEQAAAFTDGVDWTSTLVIPVPRNAAVYEQVSVDGVTGTLIQRTSNDGDAPQFSLIWVKDGIIYAISGLGTDSDKAIEMANSLQ
jgi:hypothetical protein